MDALLRYHRAPIRLPGGVDKVINSFLAAKLAISSLRVMAPSPFRRPNAESMTLRYSW